MASMGQTLTIGQTWRRKRDKTHWTVQQVHRPDRLAELRAEGEKLSVRFTELRRKYELIS